MRFRTMNADRSSAIVTIDQLVDKLRGPWIYWTNGSTCLPPITTAGDCTAVAMPAKLSGTESYRMSNRERQPSQTPLFGHIDVSTHAANQQGNGSVTEMLTEMVTAQNRQNELLEQLIQQMSAAQRQRSNELGQWKQANPRLAKRCRDAAETLGQIQTQFLETVTEEIEENSDSMMDGEFMLNEFVDRFGPRLAHLNGVLQVLSQLSSIPAAQDGP